MSDLDPNTIAALIRKMQNQISNLTSQIQQVKMNNGAPVSLPGQYSGKPIPSMIGVEMTIPAASVVPVQQPILVNAEAPFMAKSIHFAYRPTAGANAGSWRPISSVNDIAAAGIAQDIFNFYWEYQVTGSHRNRQDVAVPSALVDRSEQGNGTWSFHIEDTFSPSVSIIVKVTPTRGMTNAGVLYVGFHGSYLLE